MAKMTVNVEVCKGCGMCVPACPKKIIALSTDKLNSRGFYPAEVVEPEKCIGCAMCALMRPDCAITVVR